MPPRLLHYSDLENVYDTPDAAGRLATLLQERAGGDAVLAGSGDNTAPGVLSLVSEGRQSLVLYDAVQPDVETFGNHDFDYGPDGTLDIVRASPQTWVSANTHLPNEDGADTDFAPFGRDDGVVQYTIESIDGVRVGFFGVLDADTPALNPAAGDLAVTDPIDAGREAVSALREQGVDHVVALSHLGRGDDDLAELVDVDVVLGGHVPAERIERRHGTLLTRPGSGGHTVLEIDLATGDVTRHQAADFPVDEDVADELRARMAAAGLDEVVGHVETPIERTETTLFHGESRAGNFVADAYRWAADADAALQNAGGVRDGPEIHGDVTIADLVSLVPFDEPVSVARLTGRELRAVLEGARTSDLGFAEPHWWHAHVSGATITWNDTADELLAIEIDGEPLDPDATYTLATTDYLFHTTDEFPALDAEHRVESLDVQHEVLAAYAREHGVDPRIEGRIKRVSRSDDAIRGNPVESPGDEEN